MMAPTPRPDDSEQIENTKDFPQPRAQKLTTVEWSLLTLTALTLLSAAIIVGGLAYFDR